MSKHIANKQGGVEPSLFMSNGVEKGGGGVAPSPIVLKHVRNKQGGVEPSLFMSNGVEKGGEGLCPPQLC